MAKCMDFFVYVGVMFLCFFMALHCFDKRPSTPPNPEFHKIEIRDDFFDAWRAAFQSPRAVKPKKITELPKKKVNRPSEPSSGAPIEVDDVIIKGIR